MTEFQGADVAQLRAFAMEAAKAAQQLKSTAALLSQAVTSSNAWQGPDAERFRQQWMSQQRPILNKVGFRLLDISKMLRIQADEQDKASSSASLEGSPGGVRAPVDPGPANVPPTGPEDHSQPRYPVSKETKLDKGELEELRRLAKEAANPDNSVKGNDGDVSKLREALEKLSPGQVKQFLDSLSDQELRALGEGVGSSGTGMFDWQGTTPFERQRLLDQLLSKASPEQVERIKAQIPWVQPNGTAKGDAARPEGAEGQEGGNWMTPKSPVVGEHPGKDDVRQGGYGDCVVMAQIGALANNDPNWVKNHVTDNGNGTVSVKLYDSDGEPRWVTVTKDVPADASGREIGAHPTTENAWPAYVEKALTQVYEGDTDGDGENSHGVKDQAYGPGEYRAIEGNYGPDTMKYLTGAGGEQTDDSGKLWEAVDNGKAAIVTTEGKVPDGAPTGYVAGHAFMVAGKDDEGNIILQNPWGPGEPTMTISQGDFDKYFQNATVAK